MNRVLPILFNTNMVRAILDGRKTATRRVIMPHNRKKAKEQGYYQKNGLWVDDRIDNGDVMGHIKDYSVSSCWMRYSMYLAKYAPYRLEDILYVRETWAFLPCMDCTREGTDCGRTCVTYEERDSVSDGCFVYRTDYGDTEDDSFSPSMFKWRPSIHMPKQAARIWLKVTDVRVERLQEMNTGDFLSEGVIIRPEAYNDPENAYQQAKKEFMHIWDSTVKKSEIDQYGWTANPWTWVIEFEQCEKLEED